LNAATVRLEEARAVGAEELAPYEYYAAKELLQRAEVGASDSDRARDADAAQQYANEAIRIAQTARPPR
jgi:hypothetical protein